MFLEVRALFSDLKNRKNPQNFRFFGMKSTFFRFEKPETFSYFSGNYRGKNTGNSMPQDMVLHISLINRVSCCYPKTKIALTSRSDRIFWQDFFPRSSTQRAPSIALLFTAL